MNLSPNVNRENEIMNNDEFYPVTDEGSARKY